MKVCTDRKLYIVQDFSNFQQQFLGVGARLVEKDRRLPICSIPSPADRNFDKIEKVSHGQYLESLFDEDDNQNNNKRFWS